MSFKKFRAGLAIAGCLAATLVAAQPKTDGQWRGSGGAALAATSGNTSSTSLLLNGDAARATETDKLAFAAAVNYARSRIQGVDTTTANKWAASGQYDYNLTPQWYAFGKLGLEADKLIALGLRSSLVGGAGYKLIATPETTLDLFGGAGYVVDRYSSAQTIGSRTDTRFSRVSLYAGEESTHKLSATTAFKQRLELYPGVSGDKALMAKFSAGLAVAMSSTMSLNVGLTDNYNSKPATGAKSNDLGLFTGINVKFGAL